MANGIISRVIGALVGIAIAILLMTIGFWRTLLIVALAAVGWYLAGANAPDKLREAIDRMRNPDR